MPTLTLPSRLVALLPGWAQWLCGWERARARKVVVYEVVGPGNDVWYADEGDERLLGEHVGRRMRSGTLLLLVRRLEMEESEAKAIPAERMIGFE